MNVRLVTMAVTVALAAVPGAFSGPAAAGILELDGKLKAGGMAGFGMYGDRKDEAFHKSARGPSYGLTVGVEFLFVDVWIEHDQYYNGGRGTGYGVNGTWTQFMAGVDFAFDMGTVQREESLDGQPGASKGYTSGYGELGFGVGFGVGTGQQVDLPLDNSELSDKGFVAQAHVGFGYRVSRSFSLGVHIPAQAGYLFRTDDVANNLSSQYGSVHVAALLTARLNLIIK
jgi:hypothetical protein